MLLMDLMLLMFSSDAIDVLLMFSIDIFNWSFFDNGTGCKQNLFQLLKLHIFAFNKNLKSRLFWALHVTFWAYWSCIQKKHI